MIRSEFVRRAAQRGYETTVIDNLMCAGDIERSRRRILVITKGTNS